MKLEEFMSQNGLATVQDMTNFFRKNLAAGTAPVAIYTCALCHELLDPPNTHDCPVKTPTPQHEEANKS